MMPILMAIAGTYVGVASCVNSGCHGSTRPMKATHVLQNEYYTWLNSDRHAQAYNILFNERSARIARNMHLQKRAYEERICLDCHSTNVPAEAVSGRIDPEDGVQCEACHGPAGGWRNEHVRSDWTHAQSVARGMTDLRDVPTRASLCLSCHLGDARREVDHDLIASGHPLLPFELDNYSETMPPHWSDGRSTHGARAWAVGEAVAFDFSLRNLARHARGEKWPEFSDMSCFNCHHNLKSGEWREERGWRDRPGQPAWSAPHWSALRAILGRASSTDLQERVDDLARRVARMRDPPAISEAAEEARRIVQPLIREVDRLDWREADVRAAMRVITSDPELVDVRAAEQIALSLQALASSLTRRDPRLAHSAMTQAIDALFAELQSRDDYDPRRFSARLRALRGTL
jgi:cytochrome c554/c'-like protein